MTRHSRNGGSTTPATTNRAAVLAGALWLLGVAAPAQAAVVFFNNTAAFTAAMSGNTLIGTEDFEGSNLPSNAVLGVDDPLTQGVANASYPAGLTQPMTIQSNLSGGAAATTNPRGIDGLGAVSAGFGGAISDIVVANFFVDSLDWLFASAVQLAGLGFNPISVFSGSTLEIEVYDLANTLIGATTVTGDPVGSNFLGIQATGGDLIGRINFFSTAGEGEGGDNAVLYRAGIAQAAVPEPGSLALVAIAAGAFPLGLALRRRAESRLSVA